MKNSLSDMAARTSGLIFREIMKDVQAQHPEEKNTFHDVRNHEDKLKKINFT